MADQQEPVSVLDALAFEPTQTTVWVTHRFIAWHNWPDAPEARMYLQAPHRHLFQVECEVEVKHGDREIEFHDLLDVVSAACPSGDIGATSCEQVANWIALQVTKRWPGRSIMCAVSEDGECGARVQA